MYNLVSSELLADERVLWSGQPDANKIFSKGDLFLIPFSILWCGFAIFWEAMVLRTGAPGLFKLWGIPFILIGLYMVFGRFFYKKYLRNNTYYFLTNKRVIIIKQTKRKNIEAEFINSIPCVNKSVDVNGIGTVIFGNSSGMAGIYDESGMGMFLRGNSRRYGAIAPTFYDIERADDVYRMINEIRNKIYG